MLIKGPSPATYLHSDETIITKGGRGLIPLSGGTALFINKKIKIVTRAVNGTSVFKMHGAGAKVLNTHRAAGRRASLGNRRRRRLLSGRRENKDVVLRLLFSGGSCFRFSGEPVLRPTFPGGAGTAAAGSAASGASGALGPARW